MGKARTTRNKKKGSRTFSDSVAGWRSQNIDLAVTQRRESARTGRMSTPKTSASYIPTARRARVLAKEYQQLWFNQMKLTREYRSAAVELLWKSKAQAVIIQKLLTILNSYGLRISAVSLDPKLNTLSFTSQTMYNEDNTYRGPSQDPRHLLTSGLGQPKTSKRSLNSDQVHTKMNVMFPGFRFHVDKMFKEEPWPHLGSKAKKHTVQCSECGAHLPPTFPAESSEFDNEVRITSLPSTLR